MFLEFLTKKAQLEKLKGLKISNQVKHTPHGAAGGSLDRRERRKRDQALGLVPFAVKLDGGLVTRLRTLSEERAVELNALVDELLRKGLGEEKA